MKATTLFQPWASMIFEMGAEDCPRLDVLNRSWGCYYTGEIALHAATEVNAEACVREHFDAAMIPRAAVLGIIRVVLCEVLPSAKFPEFPNPHEGMIDPLAGGKSVLGGARRRFGWRIKVLEKFEQPISALGAKFLWEWDGRK